MSLTDILSANTNFYQLAKVQEIKYLVCRATSEDQSLLDVEIQLRKENPKVLATLYPKELWSFSLDGSDPPVPNAQYKLKQSSIQTMDPRDLHKNNGPSNISSLVGATLVKALKKMLMTSLSIRKELTMFGTCGLLPESNDLIRIEPKLLDTGDILLSLTSQPHNLHHLGTLDDSIDVNSTHALYLIPSGIRCYVSGNTLQEAWTSKPQNAQKIIDILQAHHGISIDSTSSRWVKVIPNLQHLNGITTQVADYLKPVSNTKYISWPAELCLVQRCEHIEKSDDPNALDDFDPMSLIDDFVQLKASAATKTPSNVPTTNNTPADIGNVQPSNGPPTSKPTPTNTSAPLTTATTITANALPEESVNMDESVHDDWDDLDAELFGGDEITDADFDLFDEPDTATKRDGQDDNDDDVDAELEEALNDALMGEDLNHISFEHDETDREKSDDLKSDGKNNTRETTKNPYDIPIHEITIPNTPPYEDPGAPLPVLSPRGQRKRSIFSPLTFNPIIKSNVDNKYANGGKFHVSTVDTPVGDFGIPNVPLAEGFGIGQDEGDSGESDSSDYIEDSGTECETDDIIVPPTRINSRESSLDSANLNISSQNEVTERGISLEPESKNKRFITPGVQLDGTISENSRPSSPSTNGTGEPNPLPFLVRCLPVSTMPEHFYKENPTVSDMNTLDQLIQQIVWDDACLEDTFPKESEYENVSSDNLKRAIAQIFPEFRGISLAEFSDVTPKEVNSPFASFKANDYLPKNSQSDFSTSPKKESTDDNKLIFPIPEPKVKVKRLNEEIIVNSTALNLWNLMSFESLHGTKDFGIIMVAENEPFELCEFFVQAFIESYHKSNLGSVEKIVLDGFVEKGIVNANSDLKVVFTKLHEHLVQQKEYREILVFMTDSEENLKSIVKKVTLFEKIKEWCTGSSNGTLLPIKVSLKVIPTSFVVNNGVFSVLSISRNTRLALSVYNRLNQTNRTFADLSNAFPKKIKFQLTQEPVAGRILSEESFIHLAYERSIDKNWCVASWTDDKSTFHEVKAWPLDVKEKSSLENVMNQLWDTTLELSKNVKGKKYLVLTRLNGGIADDELLQWKRLASKALFLTLVIVSVNTNSRLLLKLDQSSFPLNKLFSQENGFDSNSSMTKFESCPTAGSSTGLTPSIFTPQQMNSPDIFSISRAAAHESPSEKFTDDNTVLQDISDLVYGLVIDSPMSLSHSPGRAVKLGFLVKPIENSNNKLKCFEVGILSSPSNLSSGELMYQLLHQYRNLAKMGEIYSTVGNPVETIVPWHIAAVNKVMKCLLHVRHEIDNKQVG
ncbi:Ssn2p CYBJADRAFT_165708 [Cyberlindnera jadinii NRRL Y-1542]|uniref:Mediator of RNA polymerase II transcription subunit 13 n=1 Tax=Cyberlindnera jadinii (strain ATCC 18201 / CBS 1600 / BCRC 20928 / JCM 3617 / NBRC 0987 / NRRL Y-1542) TaxID=983966 RepID=A0A1E4SAC8_CYBJN|nr:hypothetical protein CYBJADRAFT_165708 [Cyberlindnera jadinii NRRL Y-1542]ODV76426.1 hypothetical protein CYBJADRAFT_165708 [Cyberlindnera jadinii NRRL Y-1542]